MPHLSVVFYLWVQERDDTGTVRELGLRLGLEVRPEATIPMARSWVGKRHKVWGLSRGQDPLIVARGGRVRQVNTADIRLTTTTASLWTGGGGPPHAPPTHDV